MVVSGPMIIERVVHPRGTYRKNRIYLLQWQTESIWEKVQNPKGTKASRNNKAQIEFPPNITVMFSHALEPVVRMKCRTYLKAVGATDNHMTFINASVPQPSDTPLARMWVGNNSPR